MIHHRPRRLRTTPAMRALVREVAVRPSQLVLPAFVADRPGRISSMPGVERHTVEGLVTMGVGALGVAKADAIAGLLGIA